MEGLALPGQSTDKAREDTNPLTPRVLRQGKFTIELDGSTTNGVRGFTRVDITDIEGGQQSDVRVVREDLALGNYMTYRQCPYSSVNGDDEVQEACEVYTLRVASTSELSFTVDYYERTPGALGELRTFYYTIFSTPIGPSIPGGVFPDSS